MLLAGRFGYSDLKEAAPMEVCTLNRAKRVRMVGTIRLTGSVGRF